MTTQETIETIKIAIAEVEWCYPMEYSEAFENAISALEKQIPKKVEEYLTSSFCCPACTSVLSRYSQYCSNCGQALDWSDTE